MSNKFKLGDRVKIKNTELSCRCEAQSVLRENIGNVLRYYKNSDDYVTVWWDIRQPQFWEGSKWTVEEKYLEHINSNDTVKFILKLNKEDA